METTKYIHFFSWATRVSIELPVGFEEQIEDPDSNSAIYADDLDEPYEHGEPGARVMTKMTAVEKESTEAYLAMAEASAALESRNLENRKEIMVNGAPAVRQILSYRDDDLEVDVFRHETFAQVENVVFSITCLAPTDRIADYRAAFDHAADTARFILLPEASVGYAHEGLRISALLPEGWSVSEHTDDHVRFFGPSHSKYDDYQPTFSISLGEPEGFGREWFDSFCAASRSTLEREIPGFELRSVERFTLSSFVEVHALWYIHESEPGLKFAQLQALCLMDRYHLYLVNAATLLPLADDYLPVFDEILHNLRMLPAR
ncbi:MAG: hypothetical protein ACOC7X_08845 [Spirochaetota bacterium]